MVVVLLEHSTVYSPSGLVLRGDSDEKQDINLWLMYITFDMMVYGVDRGSLWIRCVLRCEQEHHERASEFMLKLPRRSAACLSHSSR